MKNRKSAWWRYIVSVASFACTVSLEAGSFQLGPVSDPRLILANGVGDSSLSILSSDGRYVLFASSVPNLVRIGNKPMPEPLLPQLNVFLRDRTNQTTSLISVNLAGTGGGNANSIPAGLSAEGRYVLFESSASDLVPGDVNNSTDIFVRDLTSGITRLVSVSTNGGPANGSSSSAVMTPDGRYVAFVSEASDLVNGDTNRIADIFVRDLATATTILASPGATSTNTARPLGGSEAPIITPDGRYVLFFSTATNLVSGVLATSQVYLRDLRTEKTVWVSSDSEAAVLSVLGKTNSISFNHAISDDGCFVAYDAAPRASAAGVILRYIVNSGLTEIVYTNASVGTGPGEETLTLSQTPDGQRIAFVANLSADALTTGIVVWDASTDETALATTDLPSGAACKCPSLDASGRRVVFLCDASGLVTNRVNPGFHIYVRDLQTATTTLVDVGPDNSGPADAEATVPQLSPDGRFVTFEYPDSSLVPGDLNCAYDVFLRDLQTATTELISARDPELPSASPNGLCILGGPALSADRRFLVFASDANNLVPNDTNRVRDIFVRDLLLETNILVSIATNGGVANGVSARPGISADGRWVAFSSRADNLVAGVSFPSDPSWRENIYLRDMKSGTTTLVSINVDGTAAGAGRSYSPRLSSNGRYVLFETMARDLVRTNPSSLSSFPLLRDLQIGKTYEFGVGSPLGADMTPDGRYIGVNAYTGGIGTETRLPLRDSDSGKLVCSNLSNKALTFSLAPRGDRVAVFEYKYNVTSSLQVIDWPSNSRRVIFPASSWPVSLSRQLRYQFNADGRFLAYQRPSTNGYTWIRQLYLYDYETDTSTLVSRNYNTGGPALGNSDSPALSPDGRFLAFRSLAPDLVPGDTNNAADIFLYDRSTDSLLLLSGDPLTGRTANKRSLAPAFSDDGQVLLFQTWASTLVNEDFNLACDIVMVNLCSSDPIPLFSVQLVMGGQSGQKPTITWPAPRGKHFRVQYKTSLAEPEWHDIMDGVTVIGNQGYFQDNTANQRFYRVVSY